MIRVKTENGVASVFFAAKSGKVLGLVGSQHVSSPIDASVEADEIYLDESECSFTKLPNGLIQFRYTLHLNDSDELGDVLIEDVILTIVGTFSPHNPDIFHCDFDCLKEETLLRWANAMNDSESRAEFDRSNSITEIEWLRLTPNKCEEEVVRGES